MSEPVSPTPVQGQFQLTLDDFLEASTGKEPKARTKSEIIKPYVGWLFFLALVVVLVLLSQHAAKNETAEDGPPVFTLQAKLFLALAPSGVFVLLFLYFIIKSALAPL